MRKLVFYTRLNRLWFNHIENLRREFPAVDFVTDAQRIEEEIESADALVAGEIHLVDLQRAGNVKIIFVPYAGVDALPLDYIRIRQIKIGNVHGNGRYVAERCMAMALAFYGKVIDYHADLRNSHWHGYWATGSIDDTWESIQGKTCAVIGMGAIGRYLAQYLKIFDCRVIGFKKKSVAEKPADFDEITLDLDEAIEKSELIFITLPLTAETEGMFDASVLKKMKGKFLVNVGRGEIVSEEALYDCLKAGILKGSAIDVWYQYPQKGTTAAVPSRYPFQDLPNVVLSPHLAGFTRQAAILNIQQTIENIRAYIQTGRAKYHVDPELLY